MEEGPPLPEGEPRVRMDSRDDDDAAQRVEEQADEPSSGEDNEEEEEEYEQEGGGDGAGKDRSWSLSRQDSAESDDSTGWGRSDSMASMSSMGSMASLSLNAQDEDAPWWKRNRELAVALRDFFCQVADWVVAALLCLCWWLRPSLVSLIYGLFATWILVISPELPIMINASGAASTRMPFPRLLKPATGVALCGLIFHWVMRLHFGDDTPPWASDWFALTNHTGSGRSWSWGEDNAPELIMCCIGGVSAFIWRKYGADAASSLRRGSSARRLMRRSSSRTFSMRSISLRSLSEDEADGAAVEGEEGPQEGEGEDVDFDGLAVCFGVALEEHRTRLGDLVAQMERDGRDAATTAIWEERLEQWVTVEELLTEQSRARRCWAACGRRTRRWATAAAGRPSWTQTKVAARLWFVRLWLALQVKVMATPTHGGAAACMVLVANCTIVMLSRFACRPSR